MFAPPLSFPPPFCFFFFSEESQVLGTVKTRASGAPAIFIPVWVVLWHPKGYQTHGFPNRKFWGLSKLAIVVHQQFWYPFGCFRVSNLVVCKFYAEALFCALLRPFHLHSFTDLRLRSFALVCALLRAFACSCVRPRLERPRLGTAEFPKEGTQSGLVLPCHWKLLPEAFLGILYAKICITYSFIVDNPNTLGNSLLFVGQD